MTARKAADGAGPVAGPALASLGAAEQGAVLEELLRARPELHLEAERMARAQLADTDREAVAEELEWKLRSLRSDELHGRAGRQRWGYVEPTEAAWELLDESVDTYGREIERLRALGMTDPAIETALGVVIGLYRCRGCDDGDLLLSWAPDFPVEAAGRGGRQRDRWPGQGRNRSFARICRRRGAGVGPCPHRTRAIQRMNSLRGRNANRPGST